MSRWINCDPAFVPHLAKVMEIVTTPLAVCIAEFDGDVPIAGAIFDGYNGQSIHSHVWIAPGRKPSRMFWFATYDYIFRQCGVANVIGTVPSSNMAARKLDEHLGYRLTATIPNYYPNGDDMLLYVCTPETALPSWERMRPAKFHFREQEDGKQTQTA